MGIKGCWTCRERKVKCDLLRPTCGNCTKARRICQGYGMQLSWPRDGDRRRAIVSQDSHPRELEIRPSAKGFLNSSSWDVLISEQLGEDRNSARYLRTMRFPRPTYLSPTGATNEELQLVGFFNESRSLMLGPTDDEVLAQFILRVAFSNPSDRTNPVLQGVFALASLQLHGTLKSFRYKHSVMSSIQETIDWVDEKRLLENLMAAMLLYHYEISLESNASGSWVRHICAIKNIINTSPAAYKLVREEYSVFLDWIYYHEVLAEFTVRHWKRPYEGCGFVPTARSPRAIEASDSTAAGNIGCPTDVLQLVADTCRRAIVAGPFDMQLTNAEIERANLLEQSLSLEVGDYGPIQIQSGTSTPTSRNIMVSSLHRLACLLYVNRAVHHISGTEFRHRRLVREGILLLTEMHTCQNAWPLFIIGCEALGDDQRLAILNVFEHTLQDRRRRSNHIHFIQHLVEAVWNQHDLDEESQVDYLTILDAVVGGVPFTPPFA